MIPGHERVITDLTHHGECETKKSIRNLALVRKSPRLHEAGGYPLQRVNEFVFYDLAIKIHALVSMEITEKNYGDII
jgi:hypothetical protein